MSDITVLLLQKAPYIFKVELIRLRSVCKSGVSHVL
jgi:hypothetical protein